MASPARFGSVTPDVARRLAGIVGEGNVVFGDAERLAPYGRDQVMEKSYHHAPDIVVKPRDAGEIASIMRLAGELVIPVTPRGAGSGLSGGAVPACGGIVLSTERMNSILEIDTKNLVVVVEPGVVTNDINLELRSRGLFYAGYPMSVESCYIGGNIAENAGGGRAVKYGVTDRYVTGLEIVTPGGEILHIGGKTTKDVAGYNLLKLLVGSEGTLAIFTKIYLRLMPIPREKIDLLALFADEDEALAVVPELMTSQGILPTSIEFMDRLSVASSCRFLNETLPWERAGAMLLVELDGRSAEELADQSEAVGDLLAARGAGEIYVADNIHTSERIWRVRRNIGESFLAFSPVKSSEDIAVPMASIGTFLKKAREVALRHDVLVPCFGHAGDGNIHTTIVMKEGGDMAKWKETVAGAQAELYAEAVALGGTISGEHGIGHKKKAFLPMMLEPGTLALMRGIKAVFDPKGILNPGKLFD